MTSLVTSPQSLTDYLWHWEAIAPDRSFISDDGGARYSFGESATLVRSMSAEFVRRGLADGDRVAVFAENSSAWIIAFLAAIAGRMVAVPLATRTTPDELDVLFADSNPRVIVADQALMPLVNTQWRHRLADASQSLRPGERSLLKTTGIDAACLTYTSGTTSRPKGVLLNNTGLVRSSETYAAMFHSTPAMHTIVSVPLCHNTGFVDQLGHALVAGGSIEAHRRFRAGDVADALHSGACSYFIGVPTMYHRIVEHLADAPPTDLAPWLAFGGAPMPSQLIDRLHEQFPRAHLANCYGLSEATSITHINFVEAGSSATDVGCAVAGTADRVSASGELLVRSPTTMLGYFNDPADTKAKFEDGWLRTGDLASRSDDGTVHVFGRVDDLINRGGEKVVPLEVEEALCNHPSVVEAAVVGLPDEQYGTVVAAAVVTRGSTPMADLDRFLVGALADYKRPMYMANVDHLPRNQNGKVVTTEVRALILRMLRHRHEGQR